jgi:four helix bundle protein
MSAGSASELACQLRIATELGFGEPASAERLSGEVQRVARMLNRLIVFHGSQTARRRDEGRP